MCFFFLKKSRTDRFEKLNAARMSAACEGSTEQHIYFFFPQERKNANKSGRYLCPQVISKVYRNNSNPHPSTEEFGIYMLLQPNRKKASDYNPMPEFHKTMSNVPPAMRKHPRMERRVSCSWSSTAARMMVITTLSLSIGTTFDTSPI